MAMDKRWARWIAASINKHFDTNLVPTPTLNFVKFFESSQRKNDKEHSIIEVRHDGGYWTESTKDKWRGVYEINLAVTHAMNDKNYYNVWDLIGLCNEAMSKQIHLFNYDVDGNGVQIGCFHILDDKGEIITHYFGQIEPKVEVLQATIEGHFYVELSP